MGDMGSDRIYSLCIFVNFFRYRKFSKKLVVIASDAQPYLLLTYYQFILKMQAFSGLAPLKTH